MDQPNFWSPGCLGTSKHIGLVVTPDLGRTFTRGCQKLGKYPKDGSFTTCSAC